MSVFELVNGRLYQWDTDRKIQILPQNDGRIDEIHFAHAFDEKALPVRIESDGTADIPNILLQTDGALCVWAVAINDDGRQTLHNAAFTIRGRAKPDDYVYTETEVKTYEELAERIKALEENGVGEGGGAVESVNGKTGKVTLKAEDVGAIPDADGVIQSNHLGSMAVKNVNIAYGAVSDSRIAEKTITFQRLSDACVEDVKKLQYIAQQVEDAQRKVARDNIAAASQKDVERLTEEMVRVEKAHKDDILFSVTNTQFDDYGTSKVMAYFSHDLPNTFEIVDGNIYNVVYDGVEYECVARTISETTAPESIIVCIGNLIHYENRDYVEDVNDTGEPFCIAFVKEHPNPQPDQMYNMVLAASAGLHSVTVSKTTMSDQLKPELLGVNGLPYQQLVTDATGRPVWVDRDAHITEATGDVYHGYTYIDVEHENPDGSSVMKCEIDLATPIDYQECTEVAFRLSDGVYNLDAIYSPELDTIIAGNTSLVLGGSGVGDFCIVFESATKVTIYSPNTYGSNETIIKIKKTHLKKIDERLLPGSDIKVGVVTQFDYGNLLLDLDKGSSYGDLRRAVEENKTVGLRICLRDIIGIMWFTGSMSELEGIRCAVFMGVLYDSQEDAYMVERVMMAMDNPVPGAGELPDDVGYLMAMTQFATYITKHIVVKDANGVGWKIAVDTDGTLKTERI